MILSIGCWLTLYAFFYMRYFRNGHLFSVVIDTYTYSTGMIVVMSSILSVFQAWNYSYIGICHLSIIMFFVVIYLSKRGNRCSLPENNSAIKDFFQQHFHIIKANFFFVLLILIIMSTVLIRALAYPPENVDSLVYHLPRAFYYYKLQRVTNIPSEYVVMNYTGPTSEILLSYIIIVCKGRDFLVNLINIPGFMVSALCIYRICQYFGLRKIFCRFALIVWMTMPICLLQSVTTQTDLLAASMCILAVYYLLEIVHDKPAYRSYVSFGVAAGLAISVKITSAFLILTFVIVYLMHFLNMRGIICSVLAGATMNIAFWFRNAIDLSGDFLAIRNSLYLEGGKKRTFWEYLQRPIVNIAYCCVGRIRVFNEKIFDLTSILYFFVGGKEWENLELFSDSLIQVAKYPSHDKQPFGVIMVAVLLCAVLGSFLCVEIKKSFCIASLFSILLASASLRLFIASITRYVLPTISVGIICIFICIDEISVRKTWQYISIIAVMIVCISNFELVTFHDKTQPINKAIFMTWEEKAIQNYGVLNWESSIKKFMTFFEKNDKIQKIGVMEKKLCGIYPMLRNLCSEKYEVQSIYGSYASDYIDETFVPQAILYVGEYGKMPEFITYEGKLYKLYGDGERLAFNNAQPGLYIR